MKRNLLLILPAALAVMASCNDAQNTDVTTDSSATTRTSDSSQLVSETTTTTTKTYQIKPDVKYVDLKTGSPVKLRVDTVTKYIVNEVTKEPVMYFIDPSTHDTLDRMGRVVNRALVKGSNGDYTIDESRISVQNDNADDMSNNAMATTPSDTMVTGADNKADSKTKIKVKDGKTKIKQKP